MLQVTRGPIFFYLQNIFSFFLKLFEYSIFSPNFNAPFFYNLKKIVFEFSKFLF